MNVTDQRAARRKVEGPADARLYQSPVLVTHPAAPVRRRHAATKLLCVGLVDDAADLGGQEMRKRVGFTTQGTRFGQLAMRVGGSVCRQRF